MVNDFFSLNSILPSPQGALQIPDSLILSSPSALVDPIQSQVQSQVQSLNASSLPDLSQLGTGNTLTTATNLGSLNGTQAISDWVGSLDTSDIYRFNLTSRYSINLTLSGMSNDADIRLIRDVNNNGVIDSTDVLQTSTQGGTNAEWIAATLDIGTYFVEVYQYRGDTNYHFTLSTGDWYSANLKDAGVIGEARTFGQDGSFSRTDMMAILRETRDGGTIDATEVIDLRQIVSSLGYMMPDYVRVLSSKVVNSDPANTASGIGNLFAGSSATQMDRLIGKWFLGSDRPIAAGTYQYVSGSLFQNGASITDIRQGGVGDCYFLASVAALAYERPDWITSNLTSGNGLFTDNGDGTFTVRLYRPDGTRDYVTVDRYLPTAWNGSAIYAGWGNGTNTNSTNELWVALLEKAYVQFNQSGWIGQDNTNRYEGISGGWMAAVLNQLTGLSTTSRSATTMTQTQLINLLDTNQLVTVGFVYGTIPGVVDGHAYTITSYNSTTGRFHLNNPWGSYHADVTFSELRSMWGWVEWTNV